MIFLGGAQYKYICTCFIIVILYYAGADRGHPNSLAKARGRSGHVRTTSVKEQSRGNYCICKLINCPHEVINTILLQFRQGRLYFYFLYYCEFFVWSSRFLLNYKGQTWSNLVLVGWKDPTASCHHTQMKPRRHANESTPTRSSQWPYNFADNTMSCSNWPPHVSIASIACSSSNARTCSKGHRDVEGRVTDLA